MRALLLLLSVVAPVGCVAPGDGPAGPSLAPWSEAWLLAEGERYLDDPEYRRTALVDSLQNPDNLYSSERLDSYGLGDSGWDALPEWNPRSVGVDAAMGAALTAGAPVEVPDDLAPLWDGERPTTMRQWETLGRKVFFRYPLRADAHLEQALRDPELAERVGVVTAPDGSWPGAVAFRDLDGRDRVGLSCASCHSDVEGGALVAGRARRGFDYGALRVASQEAAGVPLPADVARRMAAWGPGRADITADDSEDPLAIPDLWGLLEQTSLTQAGTIRHVSPAALAIRQETQLLHANHQRARPPRVLALALTFFLYSLEPPAREPPPASATEVGHGERLFDAMCRGCHENAAFGGAPRPADEVGTDPVLARGVARGTGLYRPASLIAVADAAPYFHHGAVPTLEDLFDPARLEPGYERSPSGPGPVPGHEFGLELSESDRAALLAFLRTL